jgi:hypothetical protein
MFNRFTFASVCLVGLAAMGCSKETTSSANIKTAGIAALIDVYADNATTATVHVKLVVGGSSSNTYVNLSNGDRLVATADGDEKELEEVDSGIYEAEFSGLDEGAEFTVTLERDDDETADANSGVLPPPFTLDEPESDLSRADDDLEVTWAPAESGDPMLVSFDGDCIFDNDDEASDTGSYLVEKDTLDSTGGDEPKTCDIKVSLDRVREGSADSKLDRESWFKLHQRRSASFTSNP